VRARPSEARESRLHANKPAARIAFADRANPRCNVRKLASVVAQGFPSSQVPHTRSRIVCARGRYAHVLPFPGGTSRPLVTVERIPGPLRFHLQ